MCDLDKVCQTFLEWNFASLFIMLNFIPLIRVGFVCVEFSTCRVHRRENFGRIERFVIGIATRRRGRWLDRTAPAMHLRDVVGVLRHQAHLLLRPLRQFTRLPIVAVEETPIYERFCRGRGLFARHRFAQKRGEFGRDHRFPLGRAALGARFLAHKADHSCIGGRVGVNEMHHPFVARAISGGRNPGNALRVVAPPPHFRQQAARIGVVEARAEFEQHFARVREESQVGVRLTDPEERVVWIVCLSDGLSEEGPRVIGTFFVAQAVRFEQ
jgi:hypothetical protein